MTDEWKYFNEAFILLFQCFIGILVRFEMISVDNTVYRPYSYLVKNEHFLTLFHRNFEQFLQKNSFKG